ncbi:NINE protein [Pseudaeromonas sharmana]|uniref:NINE protein n=1 Tax=Pseudaeromonas sharmana TaxID=328412 RepID=A0ABV8CRA0_9GAMM
MLNTIVDSQMQYCRACGKQIHQTAAACPGCGAEQSSSNVSEKKILPAFLLCFFLGMFGAHRFYVGKIGTGILQILTLGGLGIWSLIDFIMIIIGSFSDKNGKKLIQWT